VLFLQKLKLDVDGEFLEKLEKENNVVKELLNAKMENAKKQLKNAFGLDQLFPNLSVQNVLELLLLKTLQERDVANI